MEDESNHSGDNNLVNSVLLPGQDENQEATLNIPSICSVCHNEPPVNPIKLNCGHIFCFLCIKSIVETSGKCALCRADIGIGFNRQEHQVLGAVQVPSSSNGFYWFYEGYRGWWLYDPDTCRELESAHEQNEPRVEKLIAGHVYVIDLRNMKQFRKNDDGRERAICRETLELENILGMAGLKGRDFSEILEMMKFSDSIRM